MKPITRTGSTMGLGAAAALLVLLSGCGNPTASGPDATAEPTLTQDFPSAPPGTPEGGPSQTGMGSTAAAEAEILIKSFKYQGTETVSAGTEIAVTNEDIEAHTITVDTGAAFDLNIKPGTGIFVAPTVPGTYPYHCTFHANMKGTLTVK